MAARRSSAGRSGVLTAAEWSARFEAGASPGARNQAPVESARSARESIDHRQRCRTCATSTERLSVFDPELGSARLTQHEAPRGVQQILSAFGSEGDSSGDFDPADLRFQTYDGNSGPGSSPPRRTPVEPPRRRPIERRNLRPDTPFSGSLVPRPQVYPARQDLGLLGRAGQPSNMDVVTPTLADENNYCVIGDQSMVSKWRNHSRRRIALASWYGMPVNLAFFYEAEQFDGGGTWKTWHNLSAKGQTGEAASFVSAYCVACVGDTEWSVEVQIFGEWSTVARVTIPEGHYVSFNRVYYVNLADKYRPLVSHVFPIDYFASQHRFIGVDFRVKGEGGQHRYFVEFRRPIPELDHFGDPLTAADYDALGVLPANYEILKPDPIPPDA